MASVKPRRPYDSTRRQEAARRNRLAVLDAAESRFLADGYAATTVARIARDAGVSAELVYKVHGGKAGLVRAIYQRRLAGTETEPAARRSDRLREEHSDPRLLMQGWGALTAEVAAALTPIRLLLRAAAATDPDLRTLLEEVEEERAHRMREHADVLAARGHLRPGVGVEEATDVLWACSSTEFYELLVLQRGWSLPRFASFLADVMTARLLEAQPRA